MTRTADSTKLRSTPPSTSRQRWTAVYRQWQGARPYQEDDFAILEDNPTGDDTSSGLMMVLADGMGGEAGGALASRTVVEAFTHSFPILHGTPDIRFEQCLGEASERLRKMVQDDPSLDGMGSTVVAVHYDGEELTWLSVGDSPMWLFSDGDLVRLNADHSMAQILDRLVEKGELTAEEARNDRRRNMLLSAVTGARVEHVDCVKRSCRLRERDCILLASDGIQTLSDEEIEHHLINAGGKAEDAADMLFSAVQNASVASQDNMTFLLLFDGAFEKGVIGQRSELDTEAANPGWWTGMGSWATALFWKGMGLGLAIGLLAVAIALWWPDEASSQDIVFAPDHSTGLAERGEGIPVETNSKLAVHSEPNPLESQFGATPPPVFKSQ